MEMDNNTAGIICAAIIAVTMIVLNFIDALKTKWTNKRDD